MHRASGTLAPAVASATLTPSLAPGTLTPYVASGSRTVATWRPCYGGDPMERSLEQVSLTELVEREVRRGSDGDRAVEAEVCRRFAPRVRLYGLKHLRDEERARELVQLVLVAVIEAMRAGRIDEPEHLDRFVLGVCRNIAGRVRTVEGRLQPTEERALEAAVETLGGVQHAGVDAVDVGALMDCIAKLEARAQTVMHLSFYREKSAEEIAGALGTSAGNVRVLRHRAIAQLRDCMEAHA